MRSKLITVGLMVVTMLLGACSTPKNVAYFQDVKPGDVITPEQVLDIRVRPDDKLSIMVSTPDKELAQLFNLGAGMGGSSSMMMGGGNRGGMAYTVDSNGDINFPTLGKLHVEGMTREELVNFITAELEGRSLVKDPIVIVNFNNACFYTLGAIGNGQKDIERDHINIIDAIAMSGDISLNGERQKVMVLREQPGGARKVYEVDFTDLAALAKSPVYYIQQNDIIYVEPNDMTKRNTTPMGNQAYTPNYWFGIISFGISMSTLAITLLKK